MCPQQYTIHAESPVIGTDWVTFARSLKTAAKSRADVPVAWYSVIRVRQSVTASSSSPSATAAYVARSESKQFGVNKADGAIGSSSG